MKHCHPQTPQDDAGRSFWISYKGALVVGLGVLLGYFLLTGHSRHVASYLPYAFLLMCPLMHFFMHGKHQHGKDSHDSATPVVVKMPSSPKS